MWPGESVAKRDKKTAAYKRRRQIWLGVAVLLILFAVAGAWKWMPLADQIDIRKITIWVHSIRDNPGGPLIILGAYLGGSLLIIPITVLILAYGAGIRPPYSDVSIHLSAVSWAPESPMASAIFWGGILSSELLDPSGSGSSRRSTRRASWALPQCVSCRSRLLLSST